MVLCGVFSTIVVLSACSSPSVRRDQPLIGAEDGRSTLAKPGSSTTQGSGARRVRLKHGHVIGPPTIHRSIVDRIVRAGPGRLLQLVPLNPIFDSRRRFRGFRIVRVYDNSARVLRYGVRPGDELVSVNGVRILRPTHMLALFKLLPNASELQIVVRRAGKPLHVRILISDSREVRNGGANSGSSRHP